MSRMSCGQFGRNGRRRREKKEERKQEKRSHSGKPKPKPNERLGAFTLIQFYINLIGAENSAWALSL